MIVDLRAIKKTRGAKDPLSARDANSRVRQYYNCLSNFLDIFDGMWLISISLSPSIASHDSSATWSSKGVKKYVFRDIRSGAEEKELFFEGNKQILPTPRTTHSSLRALPDPAIYYCGLWNSPSATPKVPTEQRLSARSVILIFSDSHRVKIVTK